MSPIAAIGKLPRLRPMGKALACVFARGFATALHLAFLARLGHKVAKDRFWNIT
jgi:hypothetical protein